MGQPNKESLADPGGHVNPHTKKVGVALGLPWECNGWMWYLFHFYAVRVLQLSKSIGDYSRQEGVNGRTCSVFQVIVAWIHDQSTEKVGPSDIVHGILFGIDGASYNLSIHVVSKHFQ